jgi:hypothetical protein
MCVNRVSKPAVNGYVNQPLTFSVVAHLDVGRSLLGVVADEARLGPACY